MGTHSRYAELLTDYRDFAPFTTNSLPCQNRIRVAEQATGVAIAVGDLHQLGTNGIWRSGMRVLYVQVPALGERFERVRKALHEQVRQVPGASLDVTLLSRFSGQFVSHPPDLIVAECDVTRFAKQFEAFRDRGTSILKGEEEVWTAMERESATPALWFALLGGVPLVFVYDGDQPPAQVYDLHLDTKRVSFVPTEGVAATEFLQTAAYRIDAGLLPVRIVQRHSFHKEGEKHVSREIPRFIGEVVADTFENDGIARAVFAVCHERYGADFRAARTLCLLSRYARQVCTEHLEGTPLQIQCAIVDDGWWRQNRERYHQVLEFRDNAPRMSMRDLPSLKKSSHLSDGISSLFVLSTEGVFLALVEVPSAGSGAHAPPPASPSTRERLTALSKMFQGFVVSTDPHGRVWIDCGHMMSPAIHLHESWAFDTTAGPIAEMKHALDGHKVDSAVIDQLAEIVRVLSDERIGGFLVLHPDPASLCGLLRARQLRGELQPHFCLPMDICRVTLPAIVRLLSLDGSHLIDFQGQIRLLCQHLNPEDPSRHSQESGTKHTTARNVAHAAPDAVVIVISHDGPVTVFAGGIKTTAAGKARI